MAKRRVKPVPLALSLFSFFYLVYVISQGNSKMTGDELGGDPGGQVLPLIFSLLLFAGSVYLAFTEKPDENAPETPRETRALFAWTLVLAILYVALHRLLGFVVSTTCLAFLLIWAYSAEIGGKGKAKEAACGTLLSLVAELAIYTLCRFVTRNLLILGRKGAIPGFFGSSVTVAFLCIALTILYLWILRIVSRRAEGEKALLLQTARIAVGTTQLLYLVFRQLFLVELVKGIVAW